MFELVIQTGKHRGARLTLPLDKPIVVGRDDGCQLTIPSSLVSRRHCELTHTTEGVLVHDLSSQNGTYLNDVAITSPTLMVVADMLRIGACVFELQPQQAVAKSEKVPGEATPPPPSSATPRANVKPPPSRKAAPGGMAVSDDEIADWLTDEDTVTGLSASSAGDTTIIQGRGASPKPEPAQPAPPPAKPKTFRSVKEEAADIIRRHWAKVRGE